MIRPLLMALLLAAPTVKAADELRVSQLEQDVRDLQRQVQALSRQIESQRLTAPAAPPAPAQPRDASAPATAATPAWVDAAKWRRIQPGMSELEVIAILGPPTSMRVQQADRVLLYAIEIGASGFLGGSVTLRDRNVASVQKPTLR